MSLSFLLSLALGKSPKPPRTYCAGIAVDAVVADASTVVIQRASLSRGLLRPFSTSSQARVEHRRTRRGTRCDESRWGASDAGLASRGGDADWHQQGESNPGLSAFQ